MVAASLAALQGAPAGTHPEVFTSRTPAGEDQSPYRATDTVFVSDESSFQAWLGAYDPMFRTMVRLGPTLDCSSAVAEPFRFQELARSDWVPLNLTGAEPAARFLLPCENPAQELVYDSSSRELLFFLPAQPSLTFNETWGLVDGNWTNLTTQVPELPWVTGADWIDDPALGGVLEIGESYDAETLSVEPPVETWLFANDAWENVTAQVGYPGNFTLFQSYFYDPVLGDAFLLGGGSEWALAPGREWTNMLTTYPLPSLISNRSTPVLAFDSTLGEPLMLASQGLSSATVLANGTAEYSPAPPPLEWELESGGWMNVSMGVQIGPSALYWSAMADDPGAGGLALIEQQTSTYEPSCCPQVPCAVTAPPAHVPYLTDLWIYSNGTWRDLTPANAGAPYDVFFPDACPSEYDEGLPFVVVGAGLFVALAVWLGALFGREKLESGLGGIAPLDGRHDERTIGGEAPPKPPDPEI